jgi:hypothetical protein
VPGVITHYRRWRMHVTAPPTRGRASPSWRSVAHVGLRKRADFRPHSVACLLRCPLR